MDNFSYHTTLLNDIFQRYGLYFIAILVALFVYIYSPKKGIKNLVKGGG